MTQHAQLKFKVEDEKRKNSRVKNTRTMEEWKTKAAGTEVRMILHGKIVQLCSFENT